ncbi:hypothetical protein ACSBR1_004662 [Camellia fascicularis]
MFWASVNEFRTVLCKFAVECGFQFKYVKNNSIRITDVCKFATSTGCAWLVHARVSAFNRVFCLKRFVNVHSCGAAVRTDMNSCTGLDLVSDVIADRVREQPLTRFTDVVFSMKNDFGLDISYRVAWLGIQKARGKVYGDHAMSFDQLRWYSNAVIENNPHSYINLDFDQQSGRFVHYFISFLVCIDGFNHCRLLLFLNGTFLKGRFKGNMLVATSKDGNQDEGRTLTFVFDCNVGLLQSMPNFFPLSHHAFCLLHLQMNLRDQMKYVSAEQKIELMRKLREWAYAPTISCFNHKIEILKQCSRVIVGNLLEDLDLKHWANAYFSGRKYGEICSNAAESFNN